MRLSPAERFAAKYFINPETGCWVWTACRVKAGYGLFGFNGKLVLVHRYSWESYSGTKIPDGMRSQALKDKFPDCLNGIAIAEYDYHVIPTEESPRLLDSANDLNAAFAD